MFDSDVLTRSGTVLLDSARSDAENGWSWCFTAPERVLAATSATEVSDLVEELGAATSSGKYVAGYLSYEAGYSFVDLDIPEQANMPLSWFGVYDEPQRLSPREVEEGLRSMEPPGPLEDIQLDVSRSRYVSAIDTIRSYIRAGDLYQVNYTAPLRFQYSGDPRALYCRLRQRQRVPYAAFLNLGDQQVLSCSPELFFRWDADKVVTRPMKGTIRRGRTLEEDRDLRQTLATDPKNRAENLMIVDLLRNDLSVCCRPGTVTVPELYATESYETITQMTSTVKGRLASGAGLDDVLKALFPCGSVTGAPKRRAMRRIRELEPNPRGVYCGAIGMAGPDETAVFNVAIRTAVLDGEEGRMGIGSGIVWDSDPEAEYEECQLKGQFLTGDEDDEKQDSTADLKLIESMRYEDGEIPLLDRHVDRLARSATYFSFPFDEDRFRRALSDGLSGREGDPPSKVRVTLDRWGEFEVTTSSISPKTNGPWRVTVADERVDSSDPFLYHKTTRRGVYDRALRSVKNAGCDEAILLNEEGEVTEGTYSNVFVRKDGELLTPPVDCGLLAGVYREYVLETRSDATERVLTLDDLRNAQALFCCNAVRGWHRAELIEARGAE